MSDRSAPRGRWLGLVVLASLAVNCLLIGVMFGSGVTGPALRGEPPAAAPPAGAPQAGMPLAGGGFGQRVSRLPEAERRKFMMAMRPYRPGIRAARMALIDARRRLGATVAQPDFNAAAVAAAFADVRAHATALQERVQEATTTALATLSAQSRRELAGTLNEPP